MYEEDVNMVDIEEEDLPTEQAFQAAMQKHTATLKVEAMQIETNFLEDYIYNKNFQCTSNGFIFDNIPKYNWSYVEFLSTKFGAREKEKNKYILNWCGPDAQYMDLEEETAVFNNWCHNTNDWPIKETIPVSEEWPKLVTESETDVWNLPDPYT
ncbi:11070_t:CDS:2 [Gigaspora margarita]|uniref:11070_t:CDS:1 n=1 Tax=Gigaspora margarita TaxID=4874 RepID=A0ABN7VQ48_GIGMA|nr:11070_t:CDS:2 [Gigaspora margarita]